MTAILGTGQIQPSAIPSKYEESQDFSLRSKGHEVRIPARRSINPLTCGASLNVQDMGEDEGRHDGSIGFDDEPGRVDSDFLPGDFFVGHGSGI